MEDSLSPQASGLSERRIVVTGGTGALGRSVVGTLIARGAECIVPYVSDAELDGFGFADHPRVRLVGGLDLATEDHVEQLYRTASGLWGSVHLAGGFAMAPITETGRGELDRMVNANFVTCYLCCAAAVRRMGKGGGRIVNIAARPALHWRTGKGMTAYAASKAAVAALTAALAEEVGSRGIVVNAIAPSVLDTPANRSAMPEADYSEWVAPAEVGALVAFLLEPATRSTQGAIIPIFGRS